ncbi:hypothetical protein BH20BAC1_BH20BAC1_25420 [soil metagenome]
MYQEIVDIPLAVKNFFAACGSVELPKAVPYLGMGSSYFASLAFKYLGINIYPEIASEFYNYLSGEKKLPYGVILSQSGRSTETIWCTKLFEKYIAVSNDGASPLCTQPGVDKVILLKAGTEEYSSTKTYINTLLALFQGFNIDTKVATKVLEMKMAEYELRGKQIAEHIFSNLQRENSNGYYILGSGPNIATAKQAALILSETTKMTFQGLAMGQYDHGPKETAANSTVIQILSKGKSYQRALELNKTITAAGAKVFGVGEEEVSEALSILHNIIPFNFLGYYLARALNIGQTFIVGGKVTEVAG